MEAVSETVMGNRFRAAISFSLQTFLCLVILTKPASQTDQASTLTVWNVGQGQWVTYQNPKTCLHFDMGGERMAWRRLLKSCGHKKNTLYLSHGDTDHMNMVARAQRQLKDLCLAAEPQHPLSPAKRSVLKKVPTCPSLERSDSHVQQLRSPTARKKTSNAESLVFALHSVALIPGDSPATEERRWARTPIATKLRILVLGHHGSQTSTSEVLLDRLPHLQVAVASARRGKYGHPHSTVERRLRDRKIPLLRTEIWGNIHFEY